MDNDYEIELRFPPTLRIKCIKLFKECREFETPSDLRTFARLTQLTLVVECIPQQAELKYNDLMLNLLKTKNKASSEPVLFELLDALAVEYQEQERGKDFKELKEEVKSAFLQTKGSEQEKDYLQVVEGGAPGADAAAAGNWVEEAGDDLDELALRITLAVFSGTAFEVVERAKDDLLAMLKELVPPPPPPDPEKPPQPPPVAPNVPLMRRLEKAGARETEGKPPEWRRVVELERPELAGEALVYAWELNRETKWRQKLIEWLTNYAAGRAADVRTRAAVAVGRLAIKDYRFVRDRLLNTWVRKNDPQFRTAIGMALGVLVREESFVEEVQGLLREWAESPEEDKRWVAMRAYIYVGAYCRPPSEAIACWREIASSEPAAILIPISEHEAVRLNNPLHMSLMDAMVRFFVGVALMPEEEREPLVGGILGELKKWIAASDGSEWLGLFLFTTLAQLMVGSTGNGESDDAPLLLQLVSDGQAEGEVAYRSQLAGIFEVMMRNGATITEAKELLCDWLGWVDGLQDSLPSYESRIRTLLEEIIAADASGRMRGKLRLCLRDCGRKRVVERILSDL